MCGISGYVDISQNSNLGEVILKMTNRLAHRGPDGSGFALFSPNGNQPPSEDALAFTKLTNPIWKLHSDRFNLALGHCRLAVIDQSMHAHQPMTDSDNRYWITYNGEVYNFSALRLTLESEGYEFFSQSDTEVVLNAYRHWGQDCVKYFEGMWSFVIYDRCTNTLFGSRDRLGVKPLYYSSNAHFFAFASEVKAFLELPHLKIEVNTDAVIPFLFASSIEKNGETFLKAVHELKPGSAFVYDLSTHVFSTFSYPNFSEQWPVKGGNITEVKETLYGHLKQAVGKRLVSEVPVGFCLSGGLDSSAILALAAQLKKEEHQAFASVTLKSFTAKAPPPVDESSFAKSMAEFAHSDWYSAELHADDFLSHWKSINYHQDLPIVSMSTYAQFAVMREASKNGISVMLDGQGSDELFGGYPDFFIAYWNELLSKGKFLRLIREWTNLKNSPVQLTSYFAQWFKFLIVKTGGRIGRKILVKIRPESAYMLHKEKLAESEAYFIRTRSFFSLNGSLREYLSGGYLKTLLHWEDRCAMQFSIESRTPFADDPHLILYALSLPPELKINTGWTKWILRQTMNNRIPEAILNRTDKLGYSVPQTEWLMKYSDELRAIYHEHRSMDSLQIVNHDRIEKEWNKVFSNSRHAKKQNLVFRYVSYLIWLDSFQIRKT